jgi:predicted GNAT family acetyltransferase
MVRHNAAQHRFESETASGMALLDYTLRDGAIVFTHTEVPKAEEGAGVGGELVRTGLHFARESKLRVVPRCPFVAAYIKKHPEYSDLTTRQSP